MKQLRRKIEELELLLKDKDEEIKKLSRPKEEIKKLSLKILRKKLTIMMMKTKKHQY